jgi:hypothetical protein
VLWDDRTSRAIAELKFPSAVKSIRLRRDLLAVTLERKVYIYGFRSLTLFDSIETISNPKGLCCLSVGVERAVLVCPGMQKGRALVVFYPRVFGDSAPVERERTTIIAAHESAIAAMATDYSGALLATGSDRGTLIRLFDTGTGAKVQELRRGADRAEIHSLVFSPYGDYLALASDKGTVHIFSVRREGMVPLLHSNSMGGPGALVSMNSSVSREARPSMTGEAPANQKSSLQRLSRVLPTYFSSEWSLAQFRVPDFRCVAAFGAEPDTVIIVCANGSYYKAKFHPVRGGEMERLEFAQFDDASRALESNRATNGGGAVASSCTKPNGVLARASSSGSTSLTPSPTTSSPQVVGEEEKKPRQEAVVTGTVSVSVNEDEDLLARHRTYEEVSRQMSGAISELSSSSPSPTGREETEQRETSLPPEEPPTAEIQPGAQEALAEAAELGN